MPVYFERGEKRTQRIQIVESQRLLVGSATLAGIGQTTPGGVEQRVVAPRFAEDSHPARPQHAAQLASRLCQVEMMQDGVAPDAIKTRIGERKPLAVRDEEFHLHVV